MPVRIMLLLAAIIGLAVIVDQDVSPRAQEAPAPEPSARPRYVVAPEEVERTLMRYADILGAKPPFRTIFNNGEGEE